MIKQCLRCDKDFKTDAYRVKIGRGRYCSRDCYWTAPERLEKCRQNMSGENNPYYGLKGNLHPRFKEKDKRYKGDEVSYNVLHKWINRNKPYTGFCEHCGITEAGRRLDAANISGEYKRDINDYKWLCIRCHRKFDFTEKTRERLYKALMKRHHPELFI